MASAVIRLAPEGLYLHEDGAHAVVGVSNVYLRKGAVFVVSSKPGPVLSAFAQTDETLGAARGIIAGITGGGPGSYVYLYDTRLGRRLDLEDESDYARAAGNYANVWFQIMWLVPEPRCIEVTGG